MIVTAVTIKAGLEVVKPRLANGESQNARRTIWGTLRVTYIGDESNPSRTLGFLWYSSGRANQPVQRQ